MRRPVLVVIATAVVLATSSCSGGGTITLTGSESGSGSGSESGGGSTTPIVDAAPIDGSQVAPDDWEETTTDRGVVYRHPADWETHTESGDEADIDYVFVDPAGTAEFRRNINILLDDRLEYESLEAYTDLSMAQFDRGDFPHGEVLDAQLSGQPAQQVVYEMGLGSETIRALGVWIVIDGQAWVVTYTAPPDRFDDDLDDDLAVIASIELPL